MKYGNDFRYDLKVGQTGEKLLGAILEDSTIEVKTDLLARRTGNVFIEYEYKGKKSGLARSQADWWAFVLSDDIIHIISSGALKTKCRQYFGTQRDVVGGDRNKSKGILLPIKELIA